MDPIECCCSINDSNVSYTILTDSDDYEIMFGKGLTETEIIAKVISITITDSSQEVIIRLKYLYACIAFGNCVRINASLRGIVNVLHYITHRTQYFQNVSTTLLQLLELVMLSKELVSSWKPFLTKILEIVICGFRFDSKSTPRIVTIMENIAAALPIEKILKIIHSYLTIEYMDLKAWDQLLWSLKLLSTLATQHGDKITSKDVRKVKHTLVLLTQDNCDLVSTSSVYALVDLYVYTSACKAKNRIIQELEELIPHNMHIVREYYEEIHFFFYETATASVEPDTNEGRSESEILEFICKITPRTPIEQRKQALMDFCSCLVYGNCELAIKNFRKILQMLMNLLKDAITCKELVLVLNVIEIIFRCKPMKPYWTAFYREILLRIILSYDIDKKITAAINLFIENIADTVPVTATVKIIDTLIATAKYPYNLCAMKFLWEVAGQHKLFPKTNLDKLLSTVVRTIDDPEKNIRLMAECVIFKLCTKLGEQRITSVIIKNQTMNRRLRGLLGRTRRFAL